LGRINVTSSVSPSTLFFKKFSNFERKIIFSSCFCNSFSGYFFHFYKQQKKENTL
jgi:hypothetical protein